MSIMYHQNWIYGTGLDLDETVFTMGEWIRFPNAIIHNVIGRSMTLFNTDEGEDRGKTKDNNSLPGYVITSVLLYFYNGQIN